MIVTQMLKADLAAGLLVPELQLELSEHMVEALLALIKIDLLRVPAEGFWLELTFQSIGYLEVA